MTKFALITDVHIGNAEPWEGVDRKLTAHAMGLIDQFCTFVSQLDDIDFAVQLGDLIEDESPALDRINYEKGVNALNQINKPMYHVIGNHDAVHLTEDVRGKIIGRRETYYTFEQGDFIFVVLHSVVPSHAERPIMIPDEQHLWLQSVLAAAAKPVLILIHHPLADQDLSQNPWFYALEEDCLILNRSDIRKTIAQSGKVVAVINGHVHWNRVDIHDDIPYITVQSATENYRNQGMPAGSWAEVALNADFFQINVYGNDAMSFKFPTKNRTFR